jgi:hypothetical protein
VKNSADREDGACAHFQIAVYRDGNAETRIENMLEGPYLLRNLTVLRLETSGEFRPRQFPTCFDRMNRIYGIFNHKIIPNTRIDGMRGPGSRYARYICRYKPLQGRYILIKCGRHRVKMAKKISNLNIEQPTLNIEHRMEMEGRPSEQDCYGMSI